MALVAGLIYTYATAVMPNLAAADDRTFVSVMQRDMDNPVFVVTFSVALVLMVVAVALQRRHGSAPAAARWTTAALVLYGVVAAVTMIIHVPLNDAIAAEGNPDLIADLARVRDDFEGPWVVWNLVRAVFAVAAVVALARGIHLQCGQPSTPTRSARTQGPRSARHHPRPS